MMELMTKNNRSGKERASYDRQALAEEAGFARAYPAAMR